VVDIDQSLVEKAREFADTFALRAYDGVQLATAFSGAIHCQCRYLFCVF
jgi:uncharacterized protein